MQKHKIKYCTMPGKMSLEEILVQISQQEVACRLREIKKDDVKLPRKDQLLIRENKTMQKLLYLPS